LKHIPNLEIKKMAMGGFGIAYAEGKAIFLSPILLLEML